MNPSSVIGHIAIRCLSILAIQMCVCVSVLRVHPPSPSTRPLPSLSPILAVSLSLHVPPGVDEGRMWRERAASEQSARRTTMASPFHTQIRPHSYVC